MCMNDIINEYKYPLQKILSEEQILGLRKMVLGWEGIGAGPQKEVGARKEKNFTLCESKKMKE